MHYVVITLPSVEAAEEARQALGAAGFRGEDVRVLSPQETKEMLEQHRRDQGVSGAVVTSISRFLGDDATFVDDDIARAEGGAWFLIVYSPEEPRAKLVKESVTKFQPVAMHWYHEGGIQSLI